MAISTRAVSVSAFSSAGLLLGAALLPAGSAFAAGECATGATLVADGVCEVTFTETPDSNWTPPVGITKLQALLVGGGGAVGTTNEYGGGGGEVILVELAPTGAVDVTVGTGGLHDGNIVSTSSSVEQGSISEVASGGDNSGTEGDFGGDSGSGYNGDQYGSGAGAGGDASGTAAGEGLIVNEIDADFDLFANDDRCFGGGGADFYLYEESINGENRVSVELIETSCDGDNGGYLALPENSISGGFVQYFGSVADATHVETIANTGNGGLSVRNLLTIREDGSDGIVVLRYDAQLASTGFDATGSLIAGAALVTAGAVVATRRRRA